MQRRATLVLIHVIVAGLFMSCAGMGGSDAGPAPEPTGLPLAPTPSVALSPAAAAATPTSVGVPSLPPVNPTVDPGQQVLVAPTPLPRAVVTGPQVLTLVGSAFGPTTLDPALIRDAEGSFLARQIFRGLVRLDGDLAVQPDIASRIEISADGMRYVFALRSNAVFHDGSPIDADAVVASFNRASDPALAGGNGRSLPAFLYFADIVGAVERMDGVATTISGVVALDRSTVQITLRRPSVTFLSMMTGACALVVDAATAVGDDWWSAPNGSGPFVLAQLDSSLLLFEAFPSFYADPPLLTEVRVLQGSAASQPMNLYEAGNVDVIDVPFYSLDRVLSPTDILYAELRVVSQLSSTFLVINPNHVPFQDLDLRLAIAHGIDREKFVRVGMDGKVELALGIVPPGILGRDWPSVPLDHDTELATELYDQAGVPEIPPTIFGSLATIIKGVLERDVSMQVDVIVPEWPLFSARLTEGTLPAFVLSWIADYPDPSNFLYALFHSDSPDNYVRYANPEVDGLLDDAARETDIDARALLYLQAQQALIDDGVLVPLYHDVSYTLVKPHVRGLEVTPVGIGALETVWIER
ncbi:MAG TPA: peptide ABC transporter substrate-binding protein [Thermomicrobiales bacterium]|nr:peptide ABC transporter substrate-binding protein [Thermomicrobiales bacterium]